MRVFAVRLFGLAMLVMFAACGGGGSSTPPTTPSTPTPPPVVNVAGTWSGSYVITSCGQSGAFSEVDWCGNLSYTQLPMTLVMSQSGSSITGLLTQGDIATPVTGSVDASSRVILTGSTVLEGVRAEIVGWNTTVSGSAMSGSWNTKWTIPGYLDSAQTVNTLGSVVKAASNGDDVVIRLTRRPRGLKDVLDALHEK